MDEDDVLGVNRVEETDVALTVWETSTVLFVSDLN